jgi:hypothetical protein
MVLLRPFGKLVMPALIDIVPSASFCRQHWWRRSAMSSPTSAAARNFDYAIGESGDHLSLASGAMSQRRDARKLPVATVS